MPDYHAEGRCQGPLFCSRCRLAELEARRPYAVDRLGNRYETTPPEEQDIDGPGERVRLQIEVDQRDLHALAYSITHGPDPIPEDVFLQVLGPVAVGPQRSTWSALYRILVAVTQADHQVVDRD